MWGVYESFQFKTYTTRGPALNAVDIRSKYSGAKLYEMVNGKWVERAVKQPIKSHPPSCDHCGGPTMDYPAYYNYVRSMYELDTTSLQENCGSYQWLRHGSKIASPPQLLFLCRGCAE
jgi:hypothetical protein